MQILFIEISQNFSPNSYVQNAHPELCLKQQIYIYWHEDNI